MKKLNVFVILLLTFFIGIYKVNAASYKSTCYYKDNSDQLYKIVLKYDSTSSTPYASGEVYLIDKSNDEKSTDIGLEVSTDGFRNLMKDGYCPSKFYKYSFSNVSGGYKSVYTFASEDTSWSLDKKTGKLTFKHNGYDNTRTLSTYISESVLTKTYNTKYTNDNTNTTTNNNSNSTTKKYNTGSLSSSSSCTTSSDGKVCCYEATSGSTKYQLRVDAKRNGTSNGYSNTTITMSKYGSSSIFVSGSSNIDTESFKSKCPSSLYGFGAKYPSQGYETIFLFTNKSNKDSLYSTEKQKARDTRASLTENVNFSLVDGTSSSNNSSNNSNNNSNNQGNNTDPGYIDPSSGSLSCCYKRGNSLLKLTISGDDIYTEVSGESMIIAQKNFDSSDFSGGCVSSIGGFKSTRLGNEYRYYFYSHSFNNDQTYIEESNAARNANGGFKYETFMGTNAYMSTACDNNTYWNEPSSPTQNNHNKPEYQNNHGEVNLSDDKNYASLATTELVYCGSNTVKEAVTDEYGYTTYTYEGLSIHKIPSRIVRIVNIIINVLYIGAIIVLIVLGMIDFAKGVVGQKEDEIQKGKKIFVKRLIAAFIIFLVIFVVKMVIRFVNDSTTNANLVDCMDCFISGRCHEETNK